MSPLKHSTNIAARMGRWSASHRKTAIFGWLAFVVASFAIGTAVGMQTIDQNDTNVGEARRADHIIRDGGFTLDEQTEYVLVQSKTQTVADPAFRAVVTDASQPLEGFPQVTKLRSPLAAGNEGQISEDGHAVLIQFTPEGLVRRGRRPTSTRSPPRPTRCRRPTPTSTSARPARRRPARRSTRCSTRSSRAPGDLDPAHARHPAARLRLARRRVDPAPARAHGRVRDDRPGRAAEPDRPDGRVVSEVILLIGLAVGVDYSLFYIRRERDERRRAERVGRARGRRGDVRPGGAHLRHHRDDRDGRDVLLRRQDVHVVRDRDDDGRRRRDDRLADRPCRRCSRGSATGSRRCASRSSGALRRTDGESARLGLRSSTACSAARSSRRSPPRPCCVVLALPALSLHTRDLGPRRAAESR